MPFFDTAPSPKTPLYHKTDAKELERLMASVKKRLERLVLIQARDEQAELVNCAAAEPGVEEEDSSEELQERRQNLSREDLYKMGAIPKLAFCRLESFRIEQVLGIGSFGKVFLVRMKSHRLLQDEHYPRRFLQAENKKDNQEEGTTDEFWPDGMSESDDLCSKFWVPRMPASPHEDNFINYFAMKAVPKRFVVSHQTDISHLLTELRTLKRLDHPFVVRFVSAFQTRQKVFFITEYYPGGDLFGLLEQTQRFSEDVAVFYLSEILLALKYLHSINVIYRDLKPENVVLDRRGHIRIIDFGLSKDMVKPSDNKCMTRCGTVSYMAPEVHFHKGHGRAADFWSLGAMAYDMMTCKLPVKNCQYSDGIHYPSYLPKTSTSFLRGLLTLDPMRRLGACKVDAETGAVVAGGADEVMSHPFFRKIDDWDVVFKKELNPPWRPKLDGPTDLRNFNSEYRIMYPLVSISSKYNIKHEQQKHFETFNFVNPKFFR